MTEHDHLISWLLKGDVSVQYQVYRDLLDQERPDLQARIATEGWGSSYLALRNADGHWGRGFYQPKWISSHYTLLDLRNFNISPHTEVVRETIRLILTTEKAKERNLDPNCSISRSDVCVNGMLLDYATYFGMEQEHLESVVDFILSQRLPAILYNQLSLMKDIKINYY